MAARRAWAARELELQDGVASRAQLTWGGYTPNDIRRAIRRRDMQLVHRGVYVTHTGPPTWRQRAWAAVLYAEPAALCGPSVLEPSRTEDAAGPIHVAIDRDLDDLALGGRLTARVRWPQVFDTQCRTAARVSQLLRQRGWKEAPRSCGDECSLESWM
nr:hypothetical protein [Nocardioides panzhihuensis]